MIALLVRGSVARGGARDAMDLDLVIVTRERQEDEALWQTLPRFGALPVEWSVLPEGRLREAPDQARLRFALAHGGVTWWGPDIVGALPDPVLGPHVVMHLKGLRHWSRAVRGYWGASALDRRAVCRWAAKRTIRALAEPELLRLRVYSRDLWPCLTIAARAHPAHRAALLDMATLATRPTDDLRRLEARITALRTPLLVAYGRAFGRRPPVRRR